MHTLNDGKMGKWLLTRRPFHIALYREERKASLFEFIYSHIGRPTLTMTAMFHGIGEHLIISSIRECVWHELPVDSHLSVSFFFLGVALSTLYCQYQIRQDRYRCPAQMIAPLFCFRSVSRKRNYHNFVSHSLFASSSSYYSDFLPCPTSDITSRWI